MRVAGSTVLLTGATGGIGRALAHRLAAQGATLVLTGRDEAALRRLAAEVGDRHARVVAADLADGDQVAALVERCGAVDVLVANAALPASGELPDYTPEQVDRALAVNLRAPVMLARLLVPGMVAAGRGHLAFVGSLSGKAATPAAALYTATKFGLRGFSHALRLDLRGTGVGVSLIQPGFVRDAGMFAATGAPTPSGVGTVTPERVARAVVDAVERDRCEVNVAPLRLRWQCALAVQFPGLAERRRPRPGAAAAVRQIVAAQRAAR